jgi:hypothetical protein
MAAPAHALRVPGEIGKIMDSKIIFIPETDF